jgi:hypothetical protein
MSWPTFTGLLLTLLCLSSSLVHTAATSGTVVVSSGNTLKVHSTPSTSSSTLYSLANGVVIPLTCKYTCIILINKMLLSILFPSIRKIL